ncbi:hypothetical protein JCGZ_18063 [Jatropha curcas]|uniref:C-JID domain-containing protein n=1 Tax=Jatropha curcas TaxID=180498 RepID=A0A067K3R7_JATCU|nr:hypothetical protein JCGZ_18063 [Jatropha curcas]
MGQEIVRQASQEEPGKRSRLWLYKDVFHVLQNDSGTEHVEGIVLNSCEQEDEKLNAKAFMNMKRLRLLKLQNLHLSQSLEYLSNELRYLEWDGYPFRSLPYKFQPDQLVELHMRFSNMEQLWKGIKPLKMLKVIDLSYSVDLIKTIDFKEAPNAEKLYLEGCTRLYEVHQSIGILKRLVSLNLRDCKSLARLPNSICDLKSLRFFNLQGCSKLEKLPERLGEMTGLEKLNGTDQVEGIVLDSCEQEDEHLSAKSFMKMKRLGLLKLKNLHFSEGLEYLSNKLRYLDWDRYPFKSLPSNFQPDKLVELHMRCSNIQHLWKGIKPLKMLKVIDLSYSVNLIKIMDFREVPNLEKLNLEGCTRLYEVDESIGVLNRLTIMNLKDCKGLVRIPNSICDLKSLKVLILQGCSKLDKLPERLGDMASLEKLNIGGIAARELTNAKLWDLVIPSWLLPKKNQNLISFLPSLSVLSSLRTLDLSYCNLLEGTLPNDLSCFPLLQTLNLRGNDFVSIPTSIIRLSKLEDLRFADCKRLQSLPNLPSSILYLSTHGCSSLGALLPRTITSHYKLENLCFPNCERLQSMPGLASTIVNLSVEGLTAQETFQNPLKKEDSKHSSLTFVNRIQLVEVQGKNCTAFARLTSYLHFLLKHSSQGLFNPSSHVSMCLAGNEVPEWFDYMGMGSSLEVELPPYWYSNKWKGFAICVVFEPNALSLSETASLSCDLHAYMSDQPLFLGRQSTEISGDTAGNMAEKIWFNFIPGSSLNAVAWGEACRKIKMTFFSNGLKVKYCGLRIIYEHDVGEQCNRLENLGFPCHNNSATSKRSHDDYCSDSIDSESGNFAKRMKMP